MVEQKTAPVAVQLEKSCSAEKDVSLDVLASILAPVEQGVVMLDESRRGLFANKAACTMLQAETAEEAVRFIRRSVPASIFEQGRERRETTTFLDASPHDRHRLIAIEIRFFCGILPDPFYCILMNDFSKWRQLDELHSRFATYLSHHMRTPLTAVRNALSILREEEKPLDAPEREKLLDIGRRNVERLIASLDELQKVFMIESEEMSVCRTLIRANKIMKPLFDELEREGKVRGYRLKTPDTTILAGRGRLRDFVRTAVETYWKWMEEAPFVDCVYSVREDLRCTGSQGRMLKISLRARFQGRPARVRGRLKDFLSYHEAHRALVLSRIANALDGEVDIDSKDTVSLLIPFDPPYNGEKDLIHPIHAMIERAELSGSQFHLVSLRMIGAVGYGDRFEKLLEESLCRNVSRDGMVARGEEHLCYSIFVINRSPDQVAELMKGIHRRFIRACSERCEEIYPSIRWKVRYSYMAGSGNYVDIAPLVEDVCV